MSTKAGRATDATGAPRANLVGRAFRAPGADRAVTALALGIATCLGLAILVVGGGRGRELLVGLGLCVPAAAAALLCVRAGRGPGVGAGQRRAWRLLAAVATGYAAGCVTWVAIEGVGQGDTFPSVADVLLVVGAVLATGLLAAARATIVRDGVGAGDGVTRRQLQSRLERLSQHRSDVVAIVDATSTIQHISTSALRVLGVLPAAAVGRRLTALVQLEDRPKVEALVASALAGRQDRSTEAVEIRGRHADSSTRVLDVVATPAVDDAGAPIVVVSARDVTERHAAMEALRASDARDRALFAALPDPILRFDRDGRFLGYVAGEVAGSALSPEAIGRKLVDLYPPALSAVFMDAIGRALDEGRVIETSYVAPRTDGVHAVEARVAPIAAGGDVLAILRDVTAARETTARTERLARILDATPDYVWSATLEGQITYANAAFRELLAILPGDDPSGIARSMGVWFDNVRHALGSVAIPHAIEHGSWRGDVTAKLADGREIPVSLVLLAERGKDDTVESITGIGRNISQRRRNEREIVQAKEAAEAANRAKSDFLATMSHEIRTPMNGIIGAADLLLDTELTAEQRDYGQMLRDSGEALLGIINDILDLSKIEANRLELEAIEFDLVAVVEGVCGVQALAAHRRGFELLHSIDEGVPTRLRGDPARLRQVLMNLVGNAVKFTGAGEVVVRLRLDDLGDNGQATIRCEVRDTGIGIAPEARARLFQPFAQADGTMSRQFGGTGLGLAISRQIVELMGGEIGVESQPGVGSTFWFRVPFVALTSPGRQSGDELAGRRILVIDPNPTSRGIVTERLESWGMRILAAATAAEASALVRMAADAADPASVAIVDDPVTGVGGLDAARHLADATAGTPIPIIVVSSIERRLDAGLLTAAGVRACLTKPLRPSELYDALARAMLPDAGPRQPASNPKADAGVPVDRSVDPARAAIPLLLVEDNEVNQKIALAMLFRLGYRADLAASGQEAVDAAGRSPYAIILMDLQLPGLDGLEATRLIRAAESDERHAVIVALTANATADDRARCLAAGMDDYLPKPVRSESLRQVLDRWLAPAAPRRAPAPLQLLAADGTDACDVDVLDLEAIAEIRALDDEDPDGALRPLVELFLVGAGSHLAVVRDSISKHEWIAVGHAAHTLKGSALTVGARLVARLAVDLQATAATADSADALELVEWLEAALERTRLAFTGIMAPEPGEGPADAASAGPATAAPGPSPMGQVA